MMMRFLGRWKKRHQDKSRRYITRDMNVATKQGGKDSCQEIHLLAITQPVAPTTQLLTPVTHLSSDFPPVLLGGSVYIDAEMGEQKLLPYKEARVVNGHDYKNRMSFRQEDCRATWTVCGDQLVVTAPGVSMQIAGFLLPTGTEVPTDAGDWRIGILQVLLNGTCNAYYGKTKDGPNVCIEQYYFCPPLPLIDRITSKKGKQQPAADSDPAYSSSASSSARVKDVYSGKHVYCQLFMTDQPRRFFPIRKCGSSECYLNSVDIKYKFRTMVCIYKPGFDSHLVLPLRAVDWHFSAHVTRNPTPTNKFIYDITPASPPQLVTYSQKTPPFDDKCLIKNEKTGTFHCPNTALFCHSIIPSTQTFV